jgi:putative ABC transport system permease protein
MLSPRWRKLRRDLESEFGRTLLMVAAITASLVAVSAVLGSYSILTREIAVNYLGTHPASATLEMRDGIDDEVLALARSTPGIADAEAHDVVLARARVGDEWRPILLFVSDEFAGLHLNTFRLQSGAWPPPDGSMLIERAALPVLETSLGRTVTIKTAHGTRALAVTGVVHDPGLAPAWQERMGYAYVTRGTLALLGEEPNLYELRVAVSDRPFDRAAIISTVTTLAHRLEANGHPVRELHVPPPGKHPHQLQMTTILFLLLAFSSMALVLSAVLVATSLSAMLARQVREIGVMKAIGARGSQIASMYFVLVVALGAAAVALAWPLGVLSARGLSAAVADMLNFTLTNVAEPGWVFALVVASGVLVPLLVATVPIRRASRISVRDAIDQHGVGGESFRARVSSLPAPLRQALRRPARLALTLGLLSSGGAMFMTALNVQRGWERMLDKFYEARHYDLELRLATPQPLSLVERLRAIPGVRTVEAWGYSPAVLSRAGQLDTTAAYPDGRHATFAVFAPPPETSLVQFPVLGGRWLQPGDTDAVVLNHSARAQAPDVPIGGVITLSIDGQQSTWRLVGVVEEVGYTPVAYVSDAAFARVTSTAGSARMLRLATNAQTSTQRAEILRRVEQSLDEANVAVEQGVPLSEHRNAVGEHIAILIRSLEALAAVLGLVGMLGLGSTMSISVVERTRELGVMKAIGATPGRIIYTLVLEALFIGSLSLALAMMLSVPLTLLVGGLVGRLGFLAALPLVFAPQAPLIWTVSLAVVSVVATMLPARRAARLTVREAISHP